MLYVMNYSSALEISTHLSVRELENGDSASPEHVPYCAAHPPGVLSGMRRSRTSPHQTTAFVTKGPSEPRPATRDALAAVDAPFVPEGRCNHGSMEELSSQALVQGEFQPFRKSSSYSVCLEKGVERSLVGGAAPHPETHPESVGQSRGPHGASHPWRGDASRVEPRMIHTPNLNLQVRTESDVDTQVETLHLDNM